MLSRGKKSTASLTVVPSVDPSVIERVERLTAPAQLSKEEADVWRAVTNRMPADWFTPETVPLLTQYCRHTVRADRVAEMITLAEVDPDLGLKEYDRLLKMQDRETRAIAALATKMRISQQSTYDKSKRKGSAGRKPWQTD